ncbi:MAG: isochorismatase family protein [Gammaproteobacteria bacterium]|nr:isochorismatase family protein [Gammaproteobacteria bacterium]
MAKDLQADYQAAGFGGALPLGSKPALVIIDFVRAYLDRESPLYAGVEDALADCVRLLGAARNAGIPVLHTNVSFTPGGVDGGVFFRKVAALRAFERGSPMGAFAKGLEPLDSEPVITKQYASAFFGTSLASTLTSLGVDTLLIAGLSTSGCIRASAVDAVQYGFIPVVVREAVGDRDPGPHEANLFDLQAKYAEVKSLADVEAYLAALPN